MSVKKIQTPDGMKWRSDLRDEFGNRERKNFPTKGEADTHEAERKREIRGQKSAGAVAEPKLTLAGFAARCLGKREAQGIDSGTVARQKSDLDVHILPVFGKLLVREIRREMVKQFLLDKLMEKRKNGKLYTRGTVAHMFHTLCAVLTEAVSALLIREHPLRGLWKEINRGKKKGKRAKVKALDHEQTKLFLASARKHEPEHYPYFCTLIWAGLRPSEGFGVRAEKIDFANGSILVDVQVNRYGGEKPTKTGLERSVDLAKELALVLQAANTERKKRVLAAPTGMGPWLFFPELGDAPDFDAVTRVYRSGLRAMHRALEKAGLPTHFTLHALRHTFGTGLISAGHSPVYVQQQMGHASIEETVGTYGSWYPVRVAGAVDAWAAKTTPGHYLDTRDSSAAVSI